MKIVVLFHIKNWKSIEEVKLDLSKINLFIGKNSTGKSNTAYAIYSYSRLSRKDVNEISFLQSLYSDLNKVPRLDKKLKPFFPIEISIEDDKPHSLVIEEGIKITSKPTGSPWSYEYLLPAKRLGYIDYFDFFNALSKGIKREDVWLLQFLQSISKTLFERSPVLAPSIAFFDDLIKVLTGRRLLLGFTTEVKDLGSFQINLSILSQLLNIQVSDPYIKELTLQVHESPLGILDVGLIEVFLKNAEENSLLVIEEPESFKNPKLLADLTEKLVEYSQRKELTLVITTHSEILTIYMARLVGKSKLDLDELRIYYTERNENNPYTKLKRLKVYKSGVVEELPDSEEVTAKLF